MHLSSTFVSFITSRQDMGLQPNHARAMIKIGVRTHGWTVQAIPGEEAILVYGGEREFKEGGVGH